MDQGLPLIEAIAIHCHSQIAFYKERAARAEEREAQANRFIVIKATKLYRANDEVGTRPLLCLS